MTPQRINVMHVIDTLAVGGAERMLVDIANALDPQKYSVSVCMTRTCSALASQLRPGIPFYKLNRKWSFDPRGFARLKQYADSEKVDLFHAHGRSTFSFLSFASMLGVIKQPIILHDHYGIDIDESIPFWFNWFQKRFLDHYIGVCSALGSWAAKAGVLESKITVIENAMDFNRFDMESSEDIRARFGINPDRLICLMVGNLRPAKGLDLLIRSCSGIPEKLLPAFVIVGKDADPQYTRMCHEMIRTAKLEAHFFFAGLQENSIPWMKGADLAVIPSRSESGPLVLIEYLACGLPFIAFNVGGISSRVFQELPELFAPAEDVGVFSAKLVDLLTTLKEKRENRADQFVSIARQLFEIHTRMPVLEDIYRKVSGKFI